MFYPSGKFYRSPSSTNPPGTHEIVFATENEAGQQTRRSFFLSIQRTGTVYTPTTPPILAPRAQLNGFFFKPKALFSFQKQLLFAFFLLIW